MHKHTNIQQFRKRYFGNR